MEHYCSYQERCIQEVKLKLETFNIPPEKKYELFVFLLENAYIDEVRFAKSFIHGKLMIKKWGKARIQYQLKQKGIPEKIILKAIDEIDPQDYEHIFNDVAEKKYHSISETNLLVKKRKLYNFLKYRGWEIDLIKEKMRELF